MPYDGGAVGTLEQLQMAIVRDNGHMVQLPRNEFTLEDEPKLPRGGREAKMNNSSDFEFTLEDGLTLGSQHVKNESLAI